jgi:hypothetical protein
MSAPKNGRSGKATKGRKSAPKDPKAVRAKLMKDPGVAAVAKTLGVPLEKYVEQVVFYAVNPKAKPSALIVSDEKLKAAGHAPPTRDALMASLRKALAPLKARQQTTFKDTPKARVDLGTVAKPAEVAGDSDPELKAAAEKAIRALRSTKY